MQVSDFVTTVKEGRNDFWNKKSKWDKSGYIPGVSTLSGGVRVLTGTAVFVAGSIAGLSFIASAPFTEGALEKAKNSGLMVLLGLQAVTRGMVESIPVLGNVAVYAFDRFNDAKSNPLLNELGYLPGVSTLTGTIRIGYGILKFAVSLIMATGIALGAPFSEHCRKWSASWLKNHALDGLLHIGRGAVESIPLIGNIFSYSYDVGQAAQKILREQRQIQKQAQVRGY